MKKKSDTRKLSILIYTVVILSIVAVIMLVQSQEPQAPSLDQVLEEKLSAYETDLRDSLGSMNTNEDVKQYLVSWAKNKQIDASTDRAGNVIYTIPAAEGITGSQPAVLACSFDAENMEDHVTELAIALCTAKNLQNNCPLTILFLTEENGEMTGAEALASEYFAENSQVICLDGSTNAKVSLVTGGYTHYRVSHNLDYVNPSYDRAYKVTLKNCPSIRADETIDEVPNPIKILGDLLANFKSTSLLFELSAFSGGTAADFTPSKASMTIVVNESDAAKLEKKLNSSIEKIYSAYREAYPDMEYTFEEVELPSRVISADGTENLVSLMYTAFHGVYSRDDEGNITALTNVGRISCKDGRLKIDISAMSSSQTLMDEISETYRTICGLCDLQYQIKEEYPVCNALSGASAEEAKLLYISLEEAYLDFTGRTAMAAGSTTRLTACSLLQQKNEKMPMLYMGVTDDAKHDFAGALVTWLDREAPEEPAE